MISVSKYPKKGRGRRVKSRAQFIRPKKSLGQYFIQNEKIIDKIISTLDIKGGDFIIEIGPGNGELTKEILKTYSGTKFTYIAIEKDKGMCAKIGEILKSDNENIDFSTMRGDALKIIPEIAEKIENRENFKVFRNIPYYITGKLLRTLTSINKKPKLAVFMIQDEVAERLILNSGSINRLSAIVGFWFKPEIICKVDRGDFSPQPNVDSAVIKLEFLGLDSKKERIWPQYELVVKALFAQPRKNILNNALGLFDYPKEERRNRAKKLLDCFKIDYTSRAENLDVKTLIKIVEMLYNEWNETGKK